MKRPSCSLWKSVNNAFVAHSAAIGQSNRVLQAGTAARVALTSIYRAFGGGWSIEFFQQISSKLNSALSDRKDFFHDIDLEKGLGCRNESSM